MVFQQPFGGPWSGLAAQRAAAAHPFLQRLPALRTGAAAGSPAAACWKPLQRSLWWAQLGLQQPGSFAEEGCI
jgi:hypothetical protein